MKIVITFGIIATLLLVGLFYSHEQVHVQIYSHYGIDSHVEYFKSFPDWVTYPDGSCPNTSCSLAHNINEAITYVLVPFYIMVVVGFIFLISIKEEGGKTW